MASAMQSNRLAQSFPPHCTPTRAFLVDLSSYFDTCIPTPLAFISTLLGTLSIVSWLFAQMPQIYKNYQIKSTAGLSIFFLTEWLLGDATNLTGAFLTHQAGWQITIAAYYVFVDLCLVVQYFWYTHLSRKLHGGSLHSSGSSQQGDVSGDSIDGLSPINTSFREDGGSSYEDDDESSAESPKSRPMATPQFAQVNYEKENIPPQSVPRYSIDFGSSWMPSPSPRTLMHGATIAFMASRATAAPIPTDHYAHGIHLLRVDTTAEIIGTILSWCSTILYLGSRLPQLYKNWRRQSTAGLSPLLFFAAFCGNTFYSASMLTNPNAWNDYGPYGGHGWVEAEGNQRLAWIARAAPFFLGAAGVLAMDAMMGVQFLLYGDREEKVVRVRDGHGHSHWERVDGWMRGWIPTVAGKERIVDLAESQRLLSESRDMTMSRRSQGDYGAL